ncbi:MAG: hypothetical protein QXG10_00350 [Candidatus Hadarchaeales archaeon]
MDLIRIFKAVMTAFMIIVFLFLMFSAYQHYKYTLSTAALVDATGTVANDLVLNRLALRQGNTEVSYVLDLGRVNQLSFMETMGGENFEYGLRFYSGSSSWSFGPEPAEGRERCALLLPVIIFDNFRYVPGKMEVVVWRA